MTRPGSPTFVALVTIPVEPGSSRFSEERKCDENVARRPFPFANSVILSKDYRSQWPKMSDNADGSPSTGRSFANRYRWAGDLKISARIAVQHEVSILALIKGKERFVYVYDDESRDDLLATLRDHAASPTVDLSWFDASILRERARQQALEAAVTSNATRNRG